jgi:hypothetical protein
MTTYRQTIVRHAPWAIPLIVLLGACAWWIGGSILVAKQSADYSAHTALTQEICEQLAAVPSGEPYPESLTELQLTFPDGSDHSLLESFEYHSTGKSCTLKTVLGANENYRRVIVRSFPDDAEKTKYAF